MKKLLDADGIILASPVYFFHVTAQMKTFIDRSLGWGHKPRDTYKPGLAISVAAVFQEVEVADYLSNIMHAYGAFPVGTFTAMAPPAPAASWAAKPWRPGPKTWPAT